MATCIADFPQDLLLDLAKWLPAGDLISFLSASPQKHRVVSRAIREIQREKTLWLDSLRHIRDVENHPLPLPNPDDWTPTVPELQVATHILFWLGGITADGGITFGEEREYVYAHEEAVQSDYVLGSGTYLLFKAVTSYGCTEYYEEEDHDQHERDPYLGLLHFQLTPEPHVTFRKLDLGGLRIKHHTRIALDDSMGVVFVTMEGKDEDGFPKDEIHVFSYT
ncbi:hypothetical protein FB45DRAFT_1082137 [Roridomyces roridus]|uniref:F-box domain-containing protein n=1 Tax=Roridomyces roridus TaxID=1738132 RepID=A0AAD7BPM1_9AGAR|nr:hypothetical protein FB45DRAFT_1082137 [Roridomyces roridus]